MKTLHKILTLAATFGIAMSVHAQTAFPASSGVKPSEETRKEKATSAPGATKLDTVNPTDDTTRMAGQREAGSRNQTSNTEVTKPVAKDTPKPAEERPRDPQR